MNEGKIARAGAAHRDRRDALREPRALHNR